MRTAIRVAPALGEDVERGAVLLRALPALAVLMSTHSHMTFPAGFAGCH